MAPPKPRWMLTGWLPTLEIVEWQRLAELREEHEQRLGEFRRPHADQLRRRFEKEDEDLLEAFRKAEERGEEPKAVEITPPHVREVWLEVAERSDAKALERLGTHVIEVVGYVFFAAGEDEMEEAIKAARIAAGVGPVDDGGAEALERLLSHDEFYGSTIADIDAYNAERAEERRQWDAHRWKHRRRRDALGRDLVTLQALLQVGLSARGASVLAEVERACPGITEGRSGLAMAGAYVRGETA